MQTKTILGITICVICAVTMVSGCMESVSEERVDDPYVYPVHLPTTVETPQYMTTESVCTEFKSSVPDDYYNITVDQYFIDHRLYNYLDGYTWNRPLIRGAGWGLPESAELEHELVEMGCNVTIRLASVKTTVDHDESKNRVKTDQYARSGCLPELDQTWVWLMIELNDEIVAYEVYGSYWVFKPDSVMKDEYVADGKWHDWWNYKENMTWIYNGNTWTMYNFKDFGDIYELEDYYLSGAAQTDCINRCENGMWCSYFTSDEYNSTDHFLIEFGWWMTEEEFHETETRINKATDWVVLVE